MTHELIRTSTPAPTILQITLNRPEQLNALNQALLRRLAQILEEARHDHSVKAILLCGEGKAFCAGADISELGQLDGQTGLSFARFGQTVFRHLELLGKPSVAAIHGYALGGGCELAMSATIRLAAENTSFGQPEIKLGVIPGFGGTQRLARLVGKGRALELCLTGRRFSANDALQWGLISEMTTVDNLIPRALTLLQDLAKQSPFALQSVIDVIQQGYDLPLSDALKLEAGRFGLCCTTADKAEGVKAFLEKRKPEFSGA